MRRRQVWAQNIFGFSFSALYAVNMLIHIAIWKTPFWDILANMVWPAATVGSLYYLGWERKMCFMKSVRWPVLWNALTVVSATVLCWFFHDEDDIGLVTSMLPVFVLCWVPYLYDRNVGHAMAAVVITGLLLIVLSSLLPYNTAAIVVIAITTIGILWAFPSLDWRYCLTDETSEGEGLRRKRLIASLAFLTILFVMANTPLLKDAFELAAMGRPSLGSSAYWNDQCQLVFFRANWVGAARMEFGPNSFRDRAFTAILAHYGWLAFGCVMILVVMILLSGGYLAAKRFHIQKFYIVGSYSLMALQIIGSLITCCGYDSLLFAEVTPLMSDQFLTNTAFLLTCAIVLPPKQKRIREDEDIWARLLSIPLS